jgi:hypothetical protein
MFDFVNIFMTLAVNGEDFLDAAFIIFGMIYLVLPAIRHMGEFTVFGRFVYILRIFR